MEGEVVFDKVLVANRGEIAMRVIQACQELGVKVVAVYSDADRTAPHVRAADEAVCIGGAAASESYLVQEKLISAAKETGAQAIHPGYGFLAENSDFARKCDEAGIKFIGPKPDVIDLMGHKTKAKDTMSKANVPTIPGYQGDDQSVDTLQKKGLEIGFPLMIKATMGGGGKGMRIVEHEEDLVPALEAAKREALSSFGDDHIFIERYLDQPRHIEFQVMADELGNVVHLFERECSVQRRHQKVVEESPSPALDEELRNKMGEAAVRAAEAVGYTNAGTVEFMLDGQHNFYFLEMNTRIQVEHPITEAVTGIDLVKWQMKVAAGEELKFKQDDLQQRGHAIEVRVYAEDPENGFLPSTGKLTKFKPPQGPNIRNDFGVETDQDVSPYYDPMLAKLIVYAETRDDAIQKMAWALNNYLALGVTTNISFLKDVVQHRAFRQGRITTHFIDEHFHDWSLGGQSVPSAVLIAAAITDFMHQAGHVEVNGNGTAPTDAHSPWKQAGKWRMGGD